MLAEVSAPGLPPVTSDDTEPDVGAPGGELFTVAPPLADFDVDADVDADVEVAGEVVLGLAGVSAG